MAGFMIGEGGVNHGVEIYINVVKYADEKVDESLQMPECSAFSWCVPEFYQGNGFQLATTWRYDAIYCGAQVPDEERKDFITGLLKCPGGIAVMPYENSVRERDCDNCLSTNQDRIKLLRIKRVSEVVPICLLINIQCHV